MSARTLSLVATALALAFGCRTAPHGVVNRYSGGEGRASIQSEESNAFFANAIKMPADRMIQTRVNGLLVVQLDLVNTRQAQMAFQWTVDWYDRAGLKIDYGPQHWAPERLPAGASKTIKIVAPTPDATSWQLQIGSRDEVQ